jgi:hypothetical protein
MGAVRDHGIIDALVAADVQLVIDNDYRGADRASTSLRNAALLTRGPDR